MPRVHLFLFSLVVAFALSASVPALGQDAEQAGDASRATQEAEVETRQAPVVIDGETLFSLRGVSAYPAERRAREIEGRIRALAANRRLPSPSLTLDDQPGMTRILADGQHLLSVLDEDARLEAVDRRTLAQVYRTRIAEAVEAYRSARQPRLLWRHALYALGATLALLVVGYVGRRVVGVLRRGLDRRYRTRVQDVQIQAFQILTAERIWWFLAKLLNLASAVAVVAMVYVYLEYVLGLFPWTRGLSRGLLTIAIDPVRTIAAGLIAVIPKLVFLAILFLVTRFLLRLVRLFFDHVSSGTVTLRDFDPEWAWPTYRLVRLLVIAFAVVVAYPYIPGSGTDAFKGISLFIGIIFSLGSSSLIGNIVAGYSMTYRRAFKVGDRVRIGEHIGDVERMRLLVTHLRTPKNEEVVVPNSVILGAEVINYNSMSREGGLILHTTVGIGYETPWRQVEAMLIEAAERTPGLRREPAPFVLQTALGDFCVTYEINVYCDTPQAMMLLYTELHRNVLDVFNEYGVQIMTPAYEGDPDQPKLVPKEHWYAAPAQPPQPSAIRAAGSRPDTASGRVQT